MSRSILIQEGAIVVADAHYSHRRPQFLAFLQALHERTIPATQLFLMGDIFDALFGEVPYTHAQNQEAIALLNALSERMEVVYLEGNHDFNLASLFPKITIVPIHKQPLVCSFEGKKVLLAHGDIESDFGYRLYAKVIRNHTLMRLLSFLDTLLGHTILKRLDAYLAQKEDCKEFVGLHAFMQERLEGKYVCDYFIEGHFHQNRTLKMEGFVYINLGAFACNQRYFVVQSSQKSALMEEKNFSQGM